MKSRSRKYLSLLTAAVCIVTLLTGCGDDTAVHTGTEARTEEITETSGDTADNGKEEAAAQEDGREEQMQTNASRAQLEIDEETRRELTEQLLEEEKLDTSVMESGRATKG